MKVTINKIEFVDFLDWVEKQDFNLIIGQYISNDTEFRYDAYIEGGYVKNPDKEEPRGQGHSVESSIVDLCRRISGTTLTLAEGKKQIEVPNLTVNHLSDRYHKLGLLPGGGDPGIIILKGETIWDKLKQFYYQL